MFRVLNTKLWLYKCIAYKKSTFRCLPVLKQEEINEAVPRFALGLFAFTNCASLIHYTTQNIGDFTRQDFYVYNIPHIKLCVNTFF